jgi:hypothetical protein
MVYPNNLLGLSIIFIWFIPTTYCVYLSFLYGLSQQPVGFIYQFCMVYPNNLLGLSIIWRKCSAGTLVSVNSAGLPHMAVQVMTGFFHCRVFARKEVRSLQFFTAGHGSIHSC